MIQPLGELERVPTFKDLIRKNPDNVNLGLVTYPVLMAADILGPKATLVPVGEDQVPNVEMARNIVSRFNNRFGDTFIVPEMMTQMIKVPGRYRRQSSSPPCAREPLTMHADHNANAEMLLNTPTIQPKAKTLTMLNIMQPPFSCPYCFS
jgi:tryptophanyl-tRNA synthetase